MLVSHVFCVLQVLYMILVVSVRLALVDVGGKWFQFESPEHFLPVLFCDQK